MKVGAAHAGAGSPNRIIAASGGLGAADNSGGAIMAGNGGGKMKLRAVPVRLSAHGLAIGFGNNGTNRKRKSKKPMKLILNRGRRAGSPIASANIKAST